ncbi:16S rRNA (uracil(1498)-N(3))-methyltransferase [Anaeromyxobacter oryzisoli]|uniref:16S rRNA (uracil(1498)-N(3))-methyltransferase n=1 Tax=Anaeromyxobacter oryzisoli TaxID=2925408 RepID=UPI001F58E368|nr:16S rRNA (uracil(1498)-N(3))-methyltransferase [Anaeromyxobacter sp. SG63]
MNLLLLEADELAPDGTARLSDRRARHVLDVLRAAPGDRLQVGVVGGRMGEARILAATPAEVVLAPVLDRDPPPPAPVALLLALPRPKILRKVLAAAASMGVKRLVLLGSWRVEKSYWASPLLEPEALREHLLLGLEQGRDTILPEVIVRRLFKPFVEDELAATFPEPARLLAHPIGAAPLDALAPGGPRAALAIGPEGGWTAYEAGALAERGFTPFSLGPRVLRVDAAVPYAVGQVELWLRRGAGG